MSKTRLFRSIKALDVEAVASLLGAQPDLLRVTDDRRRNPLHFLCSLPADPKASERALTLAHRLLARLLLKLGSTSENCLWAAAFAEDVKAIDLLVGSGASLDPVAEDETPFLGAIKWSRFVGAERLLRHGANVNFQNSKGATALHLVLKKNSERRHVEMLLRHGADPTIRSQDGRSPLDLVRNRRDKTCYDLLLARRPAASRR